MVTLLYTYLCSPLLWLEVKKNKTKQNKPRPYCYTSHMSTTTTRHCHHSDTVTMSIPLHPDYFRCIFQPFSASQSFKSSFWHEWKLVSVSLSLTQGLRPGCLLSGMAFAVSESSRTPPPRWRVLLQSSIQQYLLRHTKDT